MNINATLLGQMLTFAILVWFTMKYVWPPLMGALEERQKKIADGIAAAEQGHKELEQAQVQADEAIKEAKQKAFVIVEQANKRAGQIVDDAKLTAEEEGRRILSAARAEIDQEYQQAKERLRAQVVAVAIQGAQKILESTVDESKHQQLMSKLVAEL